MRLILGSSSPRRLELLAQIGIVPDAIRPADIDETPMRAEIPRVYVARMAREKLAAVPRDPSEVVLTADTTVALGRRILGKPENKAQAAEFLLALGGRRHTVITAIAVAHAEKVWQRVVTSAVKFKRLSDVELNGYLDSDDWQGKAGGYGIQGPAAAFVPWISGSYSAIVGLPLAETASLLAAAGYGKAAP
ncbi:Maf family protein [Roseicitreum antarcticum]|uniref:dTTP/UTP pyrophosphatase n=1 Tax=Roseicitreum antarcticum TaxID=564137 RepID=A0A1H2VZH0_9RHOB|nr:nucleoside triphosphate pyrophosphatase [Roseicitreum antarcticum]SDW73745.1 septum formation protein [Roseicitreum antarcticum]